MFRPQFRKLGYAVSTLKYMELHVYFIYTFLLRKMFCGLDLHISHKEHKTLVHIHSDYKSKIQLPKGWHSFWLEGRIPYLLDDVMFSVQTFTVHKHTHTHTHTYTHTHTHTHFPIYVGQAWATCGPQHVVVRPSEFLVYWNYNNQIAKKKKKKRLYLELQLWKWCQFNVNFHNKKNETKKNCVINQYIVGK